MALATCAAKTDQQGRELTEHGTALFPAACYADDMGKETVPWHWHDELEAVTVTEGTAVIAVESEKFAVKQGEGFFINAGVLHAVFNGTASRCLYHSVVFHPRLVGGGLDSIFWQNYIRPLIENTSLKFLLFDGSEPWHQEAVREIGSAWQNGVEEPSGYEFRMRSALSELVYLLSCYHPSARNQPSPKALRDGKRMKMMLQYMQTHYALPLSTAEIAACAMISESECLRCFRSVIGVPPIQYLRQFRLQRAADLLASSGEKIAEIGAQCGFQDTSYFTRAFREWKGCTPSQWRTRLHS